VIELLRVPGLGGCHELVAAVVLALAWSGNASLAALCPASARSVLAAGELIAMLILEQVTGWRSDSAMLWLWGNQLTSLLAGFGFRQAVARRLGESSRLGLAGFWRLAWPLLLLVVPANLAVGGLRLWLSTL